MDKPFRVLLDLTDLHIESFKYVWINVSPREIRTIADFKISLLDKIKLGREDIKLFVRDGLLLDEETVMVLREDDTVKVQFDGVFYPVQETTASFSKECKKSSRKRGLDECVQETLVPHSKKHKKHRRYLEFNEDDMCQKDVNKSVKKRCNSNDVVHQNNSEEIDCTAETDSHRSVVAPIKKKKKSKRTVEDAADNELQNFDSSLLSKTADCSTKKSSVTFEISPIAHESINCSKSKTKSKDFVPVDNSSNLKENLESAQERVDAGVMTEFDLVLKNNCPKKKRKRKRRKKASECTEIKKNACDANLNSEFKSFKDLDNTFSKGKHTIFISPTSSFTESLCENSGEILILGDNMDSQIMNQSKDIYLAEESCDINNQSQADYPKMSTPAQSNEYGKPNWRVTLIKNENENVKTSSPKKTSAKSPLDEIDSSPVKCPNSYESSQGKKCETRVGYEHFPDLKSLPEIGTHIAYKILELDETYSPAVSEYREGIVKYVDPETEEMEIEFLKHEIKPGRKGKFENLKEDEIPPPEIKKAEAVVWSTLIEPKLLT